MRSWVAVALLVGVAAPAHADSWRVVARAKTRSMPWGVAVAPDGAAVVVTHVGQKDRHNVWRYEARSLKRSHTVHFKGHGTEAAYAGEHLYVTNSRKRELLELDPATLAIRRRYRVGVYPKQLDVVAGGKTIVVANYGSGSVSIVDVKTGKRRDVRTGRHTRGVAASRDGKRAFAAVFGARKLAVVDLVTAKVVRKLPACRLPRHVVQTHDGKYLLLSCYGERRVLVFDAQTYKRVRALRVGYGPKTVALSPDGTFAVTANERDNTMSVIDLANFAVTTVRVPGKKPCGVVVSPDNKRIYLTARGSNQLLAFEPAR